MKKNKLNKYYSYHVIKDENIKSNLKEKLSFFFNKAFISIVGIFLISFALSKFITMIQLYTIFAIVLFLYIFILFNYNDLYFSSLKVERVKNNYQIFIKKNLFYIICEFFLIIMSGAPLIIINFLIIISLITVIINCYIRKSYNIFYAPTLYVAIGLVIILFIN